jgi:hypothetical protein
MGERASPPHAIAAPKLPNWGKITNIFLQLCGEEEGKLVILLRSNHSQYCQYASVLISQNLLH